MTLNITNLNASYLWQDNSIDSIFTVTQQGVYWSEVTVETCKKRDSIIVNYNQLPIAKLGNDTVLCEGDILILDVSSSGSVYLWQDNSIDSIFMVTQKGTYWAQITNNCGSISDTINVTQVDCSVKLTLPKVFTPNEDSYNSLFTPIELVGVKNVHTLIYNRWGQLVFQSYSLTIDWDGRTSTGAETPSGTYFWVINYLDFDKNKLTKKGFVTLLRD